MLFSIVTSSADAVTAPVATKTVTTVTPKPLSLPEKVELIAKRYGVQPLLMKRIIECESSFNPDAVGDNGTSFGLAQIHLPAHPDITKEQATNPDFAIEFMAKALAKGQGQMWTCYNMMQEQ